MIQQYKTDFESFLREAAENRQQKILVSWTEKVGAIDPLRFFANGSSLEGHRNFWYSQKDDFCLVGAGPTVMDMRTADEWEHAIESAVVHNLSAGAGTGPVAFSGINFQKERERDLWQDFPDTQYRIPAFTLTKTKTDYYLTINQLVDGSNIESQITAILGQLEQLFAEGTIPAVRKELISKEELESEAWKRLVKEATDTIKSTELDKVVLARGMKLEFKEKIHVSHVLGNLLDTQKDSFLFAVENGSACFLGATPERLVRVQSGILHTSCVAGTAPRGRNEAEDQSIGEALLHDNKNQEEHQYVVKMISGVISKYAKDLRLPGGPQLMKLRQLQHLYTPVSAKLLPGASLQQIIQELHPTPALGGLPKQEALDFIEVKEPLERGWYGAPIGWQDSYRNGDTAVAIRSGLLNEKQAVLFAGCGVVKDSDPEMEFEETAIKFRPMLEALEVSK
ncbi:menaquinone-specific isochorismate synthase [Terribacillus halophilus]|uniref:isochorismate synthase n=1 Tax=Terribacillus halophilus TaxID=361279 RepID=A0A1G6JPM9_9BACI|nr:isochorismate synthase [Terribacillus halophilus]SDC20679.1 menaquinone-specific isochorismate synthase [Terribacillus halophilus]